METWIHLGIISILNIAVYWRTINYKIVVDDIRWYKRLKDHPHEYKLKGWSLPHIYAWIRANFYGGGTFGFRLKKKNNGKKEVDYRPDHIFSIVHHAVNCCLIYWAFGCSEISLFASILYAVNPCNTQTAIWLNGRRYAFVVTFIMLMLAAKPYGFVFYPVSLIFQFTGFFAPILYADLSLLYLMAMPVVFFFLWKSIRIKYAERMKLVHTDDHKKFGFKRLIIIIKSLGFYFFHMLIPGQVKMNYKCLYWWGRTEEGNKDAYAFNLDFLKGVVAAGLLVLGYFVSDSPYLWIFMCLSILQWCCIVVFVQYNTDRYMSVASAFFMYFICYFSFKYLPDNPYMIPVILASMYVAWLIPSMRQYKSIQDFFDYHNFQDPMLPNCRMEEVKGLLAMDDFHSRIKAMFLVQEAVLRYRLADYNTLRFAAEVTRLFGNLDEAETLSHMALSKHYIGWEDKAQSHHDVFMDRLSRDRQMMGPSRQVRRQKERRTQ